MTSSSAEITAEPEITCPMECSVCQDPGDCEDCLDCLYWPRVVDDPPREPPPARGRSLPVKTAEMERARRRLVLCRRVGLLSRKYRRQRRLTQRELAVELGWSRASVGRMESNASLMGLAKVDSLLHHIGHRLALVEDAQDRTAPGEVSDQLWAASDLLAEDKRGRRPPPSSVVTWNPEDDLRINSSLRDREWTWRRPW